MELQNYRLTLCYDGTRYQGWQRLPRNGMSIQGRVEQALSELFGLPIEISGSGRTDAGVHAMAQVASFRAPAQAPERVLARLRTLLPEDIGALSLEYAAPRFHARLCAAEKTYRYRIWNSEAPDVFERRWRVRVAQPLELCAMREAAGLLIGTHDFAAFCSNPQMKKSTVRTLKRVELTQRGAELQIDMTADGFLYHMARILAGTLLEVGLGKREAQSDPGLFGGPRAAAGETAPAKGLWLMEVKYG